MSQLIIPHQARSHAYKITVYGPQFAAFSASVITGNFSQNFLLGDQCDLTLNVNVPTSSSSSSAASVSSQNMAGDLS